MDYRKITNYNILMADRYSDLVQLVADTIKKSNGAWQPYEQPFAIAAADDNKHTNNHFFQAMVRYAHETKPEVYQRFGDKVTK